MRRRGQRQQQAGGDEMRDAIHCRSLELFSENVIGESPRATSSPATTISTLAGTVKRSAMMTSEDCAE
jgi:hypothetical protein